MIICTQEAQVFASNIVLLLLTPNMYFDIVSTDFVKLESFFPFSTLDSASHLFAVTENGQKNTFFLL